MVRSRALNAPKSVAACARAIACASILTVITAALAQAQETAAPGAIAGIVVDSATGRPLQAAQIRLLEAHRQASTTAGGGFLITEVRAGRYTIVAERLGYHSTSDTVTLIPGDTVTVRLELHVAAIILGNILVTGTAGPRAGHDLLSASSTVSGAKLDRRMDATVAATVRSEPGVSLAGIGPNTARPVIRGLGGDRILILEDGARPGDMSSTSADHAVAVDPLTASSIEVVRGPMSLLYGSSALGGVVNVVREEIPASLPERPRGLLTTQAASVNRSISGGGHISVGLGGIATRFELSGRTSGSTHTPEGVLENTEAQTLNTGIGAALLGNWGHAGAAYRYYSNDYGIPGGFVGGHAAGVDIDMRRHTGRAEFEVHPEDHAFVSTGKITAVYTDYFHAERAASGAIGTLFDQNVLAVDAVMQHEAHGAFTEGAFGVRFQYRDIDTGGSLNTPSTYDYQVAGFGVEEIGSEAFRFQFGARWDWSRYTPREITTIFIGDREIPVRERTFGSLSGSAGILYLVREDTRIGASLSRAYRTPDFNELYSDGPHLAANSYDVGDPELQEETGLGGDVFVRLTKEHIRGEIAAFYNQLSNYISPSSRGRIDQGPQEGRPRLQHTNADARFVGAEGDIEWNLADEWIIDATVSYVEAEFTSPRDSIPLFENGDTIFIAPSQYPPLIPPLNGRAGLRYDRPSHFVATEVRWAADQDRTGDYETPTDSYAVANVSAGVRFTHGGRLHAITLRVDNVLDETYREHLSRIKEIMPEPGRSVSALYRMTF